MTPPAAQVEPRFSSSGAQPPSWAAARATLETAEIFWLATVRPDGRPHVTPLIAVWMNDAISFCTGASERKAKNFVHNAHCALTTGCNTFSGLDLVVEGDATRMRDEATLVRLADRYARKYEGWHFTVHDGRLVSDGGEAEVFQVKPASVFGFDKGEIFGQTRWRFD